MKIEMGMEIDSTLETILDEAPELTPEELDAFVRGFQEEWERQNKKPQREVFLDALVCAGIHNGWVSREEIARQIGTTDNTMRSLISSFYSKKYNVERTRLYVNDRECTLYRIVPTPVQFQLTYQPEQPKPESVLGDGDLEILSLYIN